MTITVVCNVPFSLIGFPPIIAYTGSIMFTLFLLKKELCELKWIAFQVYYYVNEYVCKGLVEF